MADQVSESISSKVFQINCCCYFKAKNETNKLNEMKT